MPCPYVPKVSESPLAKNVGMGWNLGNSLDANIDMMSNETAWCAPAATKELVKSVHEHGATTIRVPVTWGKMIDDEIFAINPLWLNRVHEEMTMSIHSVKKASAGTWSSPSSRARKAVDERAAARRDPHRNLTRVSPFSKVSCASAEPRIIIVHLRRGATKRRRE